MKLTKLALKVCIDKDMRPKICDALGCVDATLMRYIRNNDENLTKASVIKLISEETGLTLQQILEDERAVVVR